MECQNQYWWNLGSSFSSSFVLRAAGALWLNFPYRKQPKLLKPSGVFSNWKPIFKVENVKKPLLKPSILQILHKGTGSSLTAYRINNLDG